MRRLWHLLWIGPLAFVTILVVAARGDVRYMMRVLIHRESSPGDFRWKDGVTIPAAASPRRWPEAPDCRRDPAELAGPGALALVVIRDGTITCEWYGNGGAKDAPAATFSISKTVTGLLLARAIAAGEVASIDDPITRYVPELATRDARFGAITLASLLDMRSGIAFDDDTGFPWLDRDPPHVYYASDLRATAIERPVIEAAPGGFRYNDYAPNLAGLALPHPVTAGAVQVLWQELGAEYPARWSVDGHGTPWLESGFVATARDLARIGQLLLDRGRVGDRVVAPEAWVARSLDPIGREHVVTFDGTALGYRNAWWVLDDRAVIAMGRHGQIMVVTPATRTVIVRLGASEAETNVAIARRLVVEAVR